MAPQSVQQHRDQPTGPLVNPAASRPRPLVNQLSASTHPAPMPPAAVPTQYHSAAPPISLRDSIGLANILRMIDEEVGQPPTGSIPDYLRYAKLSSPPTYDGKDDDSEFNVWLSKVLTYCRRLHITGPDLEPDRLDVLRGALSGEAASWFYQNVVSTLRTQTYWTFESVVASLYKRFVLTDAFQEANVKFHSVQYNEREGIAGLYQDMCHWAQRMLDRPSETVFKEKFLASLPRHFDYDLTVLKGIDIFSITSRELYDAALRVETAQASMKLRRKAYDIQHYGLSTSHKKPAVQPSSSTPTSSRPSRPKRMFIRPIARGEGQSSQGHVPPQNSFVKKTFLVRRNAGPPRHSQPSQPPKSYPPRPQAGPSASARPSNPQKTRTCYSCGQPGHYAGDAACPKSNTRMHAGRIEDSDEMAGEGELNTPTSDNHVADEQELPQSDFEDNLADIESAEEYEVEGVSSDIDHIELFSATIRLEDPDEEKTSEELADIADDELQFAATRVLQSFQMRSEPPSKSVKTAWIYDSRVRKLTDPKDQPVRDRNLQRPLCAEVMVNGVPAYALFNTGCTTDSISPTLAFVSSADQVELGVQMNLQLGAKGSRTKINYGAKAQMQVGPVNESYYFDVVDIDRYDLILGTPFFSKHDVVLDFKNRTIWVDGVEVAPYTKVDEALLLQNRKQRSNRELGNQMAMALAAQTKRQ
ncbi:hypothetical protein K466DRAFT_504610 [Polyporus arcularius HHB13444]|uniref:CCHC-type domain-containing protein n=1 Tax=Polyporus arcularius HHB13444 TaxID=1314778 RepID=A0A5C3NRZ8_9APHY|nr:hypothetical protein K466DRAFT_504610 [Polyporus arcularius HHB13444]